MVKENTMKQTEIGLLPGDWKVVKLSDVANVKTGPFGSALHEKDYVSDGIPIITVEHLGERGVLKSNYPMVSEYDYKRLSNYVLYKGDIVFSRVGSVDRNSLIKKNEEGWLFSGRLLRIKPSKKNVSSEYLSFFFNQNSFKVRILSVAVGQTMASLNTQILNDILIYLPPLPEQQAIAEALSDADAWVESLEELTAKKRLIKQGAMQELLAPKEDWEEKTIFEVADKKRDLFNDGDWIEAIHIKEEGIRLIQTGNIGVGRFLNKNNKKYISEKSFVDLKCKEILEGDLLICRLAEPAGRVCIFPKTEDLKSVTSVDVTIYRPDENVFDRRILLYLLSTDEWFKKVLEQVGGTTHKRISRGNLGNIKIKIPKSITQQTRIATILSDMDAELETLEAQLGKARKVKQGMMQELLTGRVRLV